MPLQLTAAGPTWQPLTKIVVVGPGIVGMPMAALLADARVTDGAPSPAVVVVLQRNSPSSGWKVDAINAGISPIGGVEPDLTAIVQRSVAGGTLSATHDPATVRDADVILFSVQTDKKANAPDYGPLLEAVDGVIAELQHREAGFTPLIIFESTLAPSTLATVMRPRFLAAGLEDGRDIFLAHSPNRVMPGRLVERVVNSDKLVAGLTPDATRLTARLYRHIVRSGALLETNAVTAEMAKTLENAYRDVRIALAAELAGYCDSQDVDFFALRDAVNAELADRDDASHSPFAIPTGALLVPMIGVGGHCLPKDGILLWWRALEMGGALPPSTILTSRAINDAGPARVMHRHAVQIAGLTGRTVAILGTAYRGDAEDTRNAPGIALAQLLQSHGCSVRLHDPHVRPDDPNLRAQGMDRIFSADLTKTLDGADGVVLATPHVAYRTVIPSLVEHAATRPVFDGVQLVPRALRESTGIDAIGIGRHAPSAALIAESAQAVRVVARAVSREVAWLAEQLNRQFGLAEYGAADAAEVLRLVRTCPTGCDLPSPSEPLPSAALPWSSSLLVRCALAWSAGEDPATPMRTGADRVA
jgi:UDP-N-acetyl-D-mannosaminuronic acid dehydrogenase